MQNPDDLHELVRRARAERSLHLAELIADAIVSVHRFIQRQLTRPGEHADTKPVRAIPAPQR